MDFNITQYKKFVEIISDSSLKLIFNKEIITYRF